MSQSSELTQVQERHVIVHSASGAGGGLHVSAEVPEEMHFAIKAVKGAPYSADARSETIQILANGNQIVRSNNTRIYRDGEGRTRQEYTFNQPGAPGTTDMISISDPVAGVSYSLHPGTRTAEKITYSGDPASGIIHVEEGGAPHSTEARVFIRKVPGPEPEPQPHAHADIGRDVLIRVSEPAAFKREYANESLGVRVTEGVQVEGKRSTVTLPAGAIGNEQPLVTVTETWFSPELQTIIYSKRDDPVAGTTIFQVTKVVRGEPSPALFQLPPGYSVNEAKVNVIRKIEKAVKK